MGEERSSDVAASILEHLYPIARWASHTTQDEKTCRVVREGVKLPNLRHHWSDSLGEVQIHNRSGQKSGFAEEEKEEEGQVEDDVVRLVLTDTDAKERLGHRH